MIESRKQRAKKRFWSYSCLFLRNKYRIFKIARNLFCISFNFEVNLNYGCFTVYPKAKYILVPPHFWLVPPHLFFFGNGTVRYQVVIA